ncbi:MULTISPECIES: DUF3179 domain-containing protein [unclassified Fusibacter]|uniref:DUF3179 domain-containing protein n=1 Tax=unclassified Fusibacter TaxID=2624464 RepID=UPI001012F078|nr:MULTISPECIES: DUF3179 domain-containing protein [unclassified Fusibacter]MCK8060251.1 DUF3179 domain-containing protein [Fusibacter sp. A2]NPE20461.1 DUF3179 domain-containing protein [Fusibacter sp. A1]RXV63666.1 DUF3179 domain-containing protein [Fusibacter sp. A1]
MFENYNQLGIYKISDLMKKLWFIIILLIFIMGCSPQKSGQNKADDLSIGSSTDEPLKASDDEFRQTLIDNIQSGGPPPDGIPPIEEGLYESVDEANKWLNDYDRIFIYETNEEVYLFPQRILVWHEIVNLKSLENPVALTYCPLTGSVIAYDYPSEYDTSFGTSGSLINSNLLMYDRATNAYISQIDGVGLTGDLKGYVLISQPTFWSDWQHVKVAYPNALVLTDETGFLRDYKTDPYGSYNDIKSNNYYYNEGVIFPVMNQDHNNTFKAKASIIGLKHKESYLALNPVKAQKDTPFTFEFEGTDFSALYDDRIGAVRLYVTPQGEALNFEDDLIRSKSGLEWTPLGQAIGNHENLQSPQYFEVMWFAWYAFYPQTEVIR